MAYGVICDVVHRLHQGVLHFKNWFHSTRVNVDSLIPKRQYSLPCTNLFRIHTILANAERLESHGLHCRDFLLNVSLWTSKMNFTQREK